MRYALGIAAAAMMFLSTGCLKIHIDTIIAADGTGRATIEFAMGREVADAVARLGELDETGRPGDPGLAAAGDLGRDALAADFEAAGVTVASHDLTDDATGVALVMELAFDQVADLSRALGTLQTDALARRGEELRITRTEDDEFLLANTVVAGVADSTAADEPHPQPSSELLLNMKVLLDHVAELDIRRTITVPGEVISSNALEVEGRTSIWVINAANMLEEQDTGLDPRIVFASDGLQIAVPEDR